MEVNVLRRVVCGKSEVIFYFFWILDKLWVKTTHFRFEHKQVVCNIGFSSRMLIFACVMFRRMLIDAPLSFIYQN